MTRIGLALLAGSALALTSGAASAQTTPKPGPKNHLNGKGSTLVTTYDAIAHGGAVGPTEIKTDGMYVPLAIPAGSVFVVTDLVAEGSSTSSTVLIAEVYSGCNLAVPLMRLNWDAVVEGETGRLSLVSGVRFTPLCPPVIIWQDVQFAVGGTVQLYGYLLRDK